MFNGPTYEYFRLLIYWSTDHMVYRSTYCVNYLLQSVGHLVSRTTGLLVNWPIGLLVYSVYWCFVLFIITHYATAEGEDDVALDEGAEAEVSHSRHAGVQHQQH